MKSLHAPFCTGILHIDQDKLFDVPSCPEELHAGGDGWLLTSPVARPICAAALYQGSADVCLRAYPCCSTLGRSSFSGTLPPEWGAMSSIKSM